MYLAALTTLIGEAIFFMSAPVLIETGVFFVVAHLFVTWYEEPYLRRRFGESYERYLQTVGRWIPRFGPRVTET
jgi:protein-S-isoprenylcysteine O-methyltransferase Ste14